MKQYLAAFPQAAVARDQLKFAVPEITVHEAQRVMKVFNDNLQAAITGGKTAKTAMDDAQREAERIPARLQVTERGAAARPPRRPCERP